MSIVPNAGPLFEQAMGFILRHEGGYVYDPADPGGETHFGISKRAYPTLDITNLTQDDAEAIYYRDYWLPVHGNELPPGLGLAVCDTAVNMGVKEAVRILQRVAGVTVDGVLGPITLLSVATRPMELFILHLILERLRVYVHLRNFEHNAAGWVERVLDLDDATQPVGRDS